MDASSIPPLLKAWVDILVNKNNSLADEVERLREYIRLLIHKHFGTVSEKASPEHLPRSRRASITIYLD